MMRLNFVMAGLILSILLALPMIMAEEWEMDYFFETNIDVDLKRTCTNNGTWCSENAICNITIQYPNASLLVDNEAMTNQLSFHNYSIFPTIDGIYFVIMSCADGGSFGAETFYFKSTPTGDERGSSLFIIMVTASAVLLFIAYIFDNESSNYLAFLSGILFLFTGVYSMIYGIGTLANLYTRTIAVTLLGLGFIFIFMSAYEFTKTEENY